MTTASASPPPGRPWPLSGWRWIAALGAVLMAGVWLLPLDAMIGRHFPAHMVRHMVLVALLPPLLILAVPALGRWLGLSPLVGAVLEFALVWGWHVPAAHALARSGPGWLALEQGSFFVAGMLVWGGCLGSDKPLAGAGGLLLTSMHMTLLGALIVLAPRDLYAGAGALCSLPTGGLTGAGLSGGGLAGDLTALGATPLPINPAADLQGQRLGGLLMLGIGTPIYLIAGLWLTGRALADPDPTPPHRQDGAEPCA